MSLKLITAPTAEPITVVEAKAHLRVDVDDDNALIGALITSARESAEHLTGRALMPQTLELALDGFCDADSISTCRQHACRITLQKPPLISVSSVKYIDTDGTLQTMAEAAYMLDSHSEPAHMVPAYGTCWPETRDQANSVLVRYQAGYANAVAVPQQIKSWMLLRIGMLYENRESIVAGVAVTEVPYVDRLLDAYRIWSV